MKLMPALPESIFDIVYLLFAVISGITLLIGSKRRIVRLFGVMTLILGIGDAFHLVPRVLNYWMSGDYTVALGIGKLVTSVTMTVFYLLLEYARRERYGIRDRRGVLLLIWGMSIVRIALCCFPQNGWTSDEPSLLWGIIRNLPFVLLGIVTVILWQRSARCDRSLKILWLAVTLSFLFYLPVVIWAQTVPITGMLMLPKTCMYIWMILLFRKVRKEDPPAELSYRE